MSLDEYQTIPHADATPRPNASQDAARARRKRGDSDQPATVEGVAVPRQWLVAALFGGMALFIIALSWQLSQPARPLALTPVPTVATPTESASSLSVKRAQEGPQETISATLAPRVLDSPPPAEAAPAPLQTGRGLGAVATPEPLPAAPSYIENVGAQAPHCIRTCDGQPGPNGGDWARVPTAEPAMLEVIGRQTPHKIR